MDLLSPKWLSEMEMNESAFNHQWQHMSSLENESFDLKHFASTNNITTYNYSHNNNNYVPQTSHKSWNNSPSSSTIISFGAEGKKPSSSSSSSFVHHEISKMDDIYESFENGEVKRGFARTPEQAQDHVLAERKRREKMTQKFVALSILIPGLKKFDKATVLGDAINYIKELQERVKELELEVKGKHSEEAIIVHGVKRPRFISCYDNDASSLYDEHIDGSCINNIVIGGSEDNLSPEIEVRASDSNVMIRVYCKNQTGVVAEVMSEIEKHNLCMISSSVMPFGDDNLHMAIVAQVDAESKLKPKLLADNLQKSILNLL